MNYLRTILPILTISSVLQFQTAILAGTSAARTNFLGPKISNTKGASELLFPGEPRNAKDKTRSPAPNRPSPSPEVSFKREGVFSSLDRPDATQNKELLPPGFLRIQNADLAVVLKMYEAISGRTVVRATNLPQLKLDIQTETPLTRTEVLQALDTLLAINGVTMVLQGNDTVKAVLPAQAPSESPPELNLPPADLPESDTIITYHLQVKNALPGDIAKALLPLAKLPNSILALDGPGLLILRDYSANTRCMLRLVQHIEGTDNPIESPAVGASTFSSLDRPGRSQGQDALPRGAIKFTEADLNQVLLLYQSLSGRTVLRSSMLPGCKITLENQSPVTRSQALQLLDNALAQAGVTMIVQGKLFVKAVPVAQASREALPIVSWPLDDLPDSASYVGYLAEVKYNHAGEIAKMLTPLCKMPNSILAVTQAKILFLRDYSSNVRSMLRLLQKVDKPAASLLPQ